MEIICLNRTGFAGGIIRQHVDAALRQIGIIVAATGLVTGVLDAAQASGAAMIALAGRLGAGVVGSVRGVTMTIEILAPLAVLLAGGVFAYYLSRRRPPAD